MGVCEPAAGVSPGAEEREDAALLRAVARGDEDSLAALHDRHAGRDWDNQTERVVPG